MEPLRNRAIPPDSFRVEVRARNITMVHNRRVVMNTSDSRSHENSLTDGTISDCSASEIHSLIVASTAHVTPEEAEALTKNGYSRGVFGWFFYVGRPGACVLADLGILSAGLSEVIRQARARGCVYVLLDRDAGALDGAPIYDW
jgi:hypothetical protein